MAEKKVFTLRELLEKHAATKAEATRVFNALAKVYGENVTLEQIATDSLIELINTPSIGRKAAHLVLDALCTAEGLK